MPVNFTNIRRDVQYSRPLLAALWGYRSYHAIARGVVTPQNTNIIILFVTEEKQAFQEQYRDRLTGNILEWEGPTDHFAEERMINANRNGDEIHIFHRERHHSDFKYLGMATVEHLERLSHSSSQFRLRIS